MINPTSLTGNILGSQTSNVLQGQTGMPPNMQGFIDMSSPWGVGQSFIQGTGSSMIGPLGVSTSVPWAPGYSANAMNTVNNLGLASPFASSAATTNGVGSASFGQMNPYNPLVGTPYDLDTSTPMVLGSFGGYQNPMSPYAGMSALPVGVAGYGGPGGTQIPMIQADPSMLASLNNQSLGQVPLMGVASTPGLLSQSGTGLPGTVQTFTQADGSLSNRFNLISDGISKLFASSVSDPSVPRQSWQSGTVLRSPLGIFESGVGWAGGNANAGILGAQASGMAWASTKNPINPSMIVSYANPYYATYNFNSSSGFFNA